MKKVLIAILFFGLFWSCKKENPPAPETPPTPTATPAVVDFRDTILGLYAGPVYGSYGNYYDTTTFSYIDTLEVTANVNDSTRINVRSNHSAYTRVYILHSNYQFNGLPQDVHSSCYGNFSFTQNGIIYHSDCGGAYQQNWSYSHFTALKLP